MEIDTTRGRRAEARRRSARLVVRVALMSAFVSAAVAGWGPAPALAACSTQVDQAAAMEQADSVFVGRVVALDDFSRLATMEVLEVWKGPDLAAEVVVNGSFSGTPQVGKNDRTFILGSTYLVVPFGSRAPFFDEACSGTVLFVPAGGAIPPQYQAAVGATTARIPQRLAAPTVPAEQGGPSWWLIAGAGLVVAGLVGATLRRRGKKQADRAAPSRDSRPAPPRPSPPTRRRGRSQTAPEPVTATIAVARVAGRDKKKRKRRPSTRTRGGRFHRSGLDNLEAMRLKTRRIKKKKRK